jgi:hypothetical protein|tara:strand:+ start:4673 stop:5185 length:513 start_codon:yes stop_codon:yes gene_type:complete
MSFFGDILKEPTQGGRRFSQGRIYLFISFVSFIALNIILSLFAFRGIDLDDKETLALVSSNLKWALGSFSLYVLGGKGIGAFRDRDTGISNSYNHEGGGNGHHGGGHHNNPYGGHTNNPHSGFGSDSYGGASPSSDVDNDDYGDHGDHGDHNDSDKQNKGTFGADEEEVN